VLRKNGNQESQVKDRGRKAAVVMGQVWGIGKRRFGKEWGKRMWLFDRLVWTVMGYGVEIWGWKEREDLERMKERYMRWLLGIEGKTPGYLVREEMHREKLCVRAGRRAWEYERRLREGKGSEIARKCWEEMRERAKKGKGLSEWEKERLEFFERKGIKMEEVEKNIEEVENGEVWSREWVKKERDKQERERWERIESSRYNK